MHRRHRLEPVRSRRVLLPTVRRPFSLVAVVIGFALTIVAAPALAEIRVWVDAEGVTHFSDDPEAAPDIATLAHGEGALETLQSVWGDGLTGPPVDGGGESSFGGDRVDRLLRGAIEDLRRGEVARADSTLSGVVRLAPGRPEAHWYLSGLARARGRFETAERHLRRFLDGAGPVLEPWRARARARLAAIEDERRLADPDSLDGPLELQSIRGEHFRLQVDARP